MAGTGADSQHHGAQFRSIGAGRPRRHGDTVPLKSRVFLHPPGIRLVGTVLRVKEGPEGYPSQIEVPNRNTVATVQFPQPLCKLNGLLDILLSQIAASPVFRKQSCTVGIHSVEPGVAIYAVLAQLHMVSCAQML